MDVNAVSVFILMIELEPTARKSVQFNDEVEVKTVEREPEVVEIDEAKIDRYLTKLIDGVIFCSISVRIV